MAVDYQADDAAWSKQYDDQQAAAKQQAEAAKQPPSFLEKWATPVVNATSSMIDSAIGAAEQIYRTPMPGAEGSMEDAVRPVRDAGAGVATAVANIGDAAVSTAKTLTPQLMGPEAGAQVAAMSPIWDHAKGAILDFRDAMAVKDPSVADSLIQAGAQLAIPFAGYSRVLAGVHGLANAVGAGVLTDTTALAPHDMRTADLIALGRTTEGRLGDALRALGPHGLDAYVNYLADRTNETEAQGRFKNALDGMGVNLVLTPLLHAAGVTLKAGQRGLKYMAENGVRNTISDMAPSMAPPGPAGQRGMVGFHASPYDFDEFDTAHIGSGQGAQSYGHGLYFAEHPDTAGTYLQQFTHTNLSKKDLADYFKPGETRDMSNGTKDKITAYDPQSGMVTASRKEPNISKPYEVSYRDTGADWLRVRKALGQPLSKNSKMYTVNIGDEHVAKMLDWGAPMTKQPMEVVTAAHQAGVPLSAGMTGEDLYSALKANAGSGGTGARAASEFLSKAGVPGIRYLDAGSRSAKEGTRNIVLFDAKHAKIVKKE